MLRYHPYRLVSLLCGHEEPNAARYGTEHRLEATRAEWSTAVRTSLRTLLAARASVKSYS